MRPFCVADTECYPNYWSIQLREVHGQRRTRVFERMPGHPLDVAGVHRIMRNFTLVGFNLIGYDSPMIAFALSGATNGQLKAASDDIIKGGLKFWQFRDKYGVELPEYVDAVDVMEVSPGSPQKPSLKLYGGRLHSRKMQDLPFEPDKELTHNEIEQLRTYGLNDLELTRDLFLELWPQIQLRTEMSRKYKIDLRSKSDAQVAEAVMKVEIERRTGKKVYRPDPQGRKFSYSAPDYIHFELPQLQALQKTFCGATFFCTAGGQLMPPQALEKGIPFEVGSLQYKAGIGGLHSQEKSVNWRSDDEHVIVDRDVGSYYPSLILSSGIYPKNLGPVFLDVYREIYTTRMAAKRAGDKDKSETLKIALNGVFGKLGSSFSALFSPDLMIHVTLTGQLAILTLIERIEQAGMRVISANTDGVVTWVPRARRAEFTRIVDEWELDCPFATEETEYVSLYSRDINGYFAIKPDGTVKRKGLFAECGPGLPGAAGMKKTPAVIAQLKDGVPIEKTILACRDIRKFVIVRRVVGGAERDGEFVGKAIRYYWAVGETGTINYMTNGNKVPRTESALPCMELPDELPDDIDYSRYVREATSILEEIGVAAVDPAFVGRSGEITAHLLDQSTHHIVRIPDGVARCGRKSPSLRTPWIEVPEVPKGVRICKQCGGTT
jgi:hypothetical protein